MADQQHSTVLVAGAAAVASSLLSLAAAAYLFPLQRRTPSHSQRWAAHTPEPSDSGSGQPPGALFSPVNKQKRPDPYDPRPRNTYLSWDDYFMAVAFLSAERSKDPNKQVGACIVNNENIILSIGYNGFPRGCSDSSLPWSKRSQSGSILDTKYPYVVHAEANALLNKNQAHVTGARIYVTLFPCNECAKLLIQAGIKEVIFHEAKLEPTGQRPATMERAAAADAAVDQLEEAAAAAAVNGGSSGSTCVGCGCQASPGPVQQTQALEVQHQAHGVPPAGAAAAAGGKKFGVGASDDVDASYAASQRLLMLAGVKLRQHRLQRSVQLGPG